MKNLSTRVPAFILSVLVVIFITAFVAQQARATDNEANSFVQEVVNAAKQALQLPQKFGDKVTFTDIYADANAIAYVYDIDLNSTDYPVETLDGIANNSANIAICSNQAAPYFQKYNVQLDMNFKFLDQTIVLKRKATDCPFAE